MSIIDQTRFVERLQFFNGQRLFASDLQGLEAFNREMRWLHNESLHQPGVGNGFAVAGGKGDREVTVGPGYAIDSQGREIVLTEAQTLPIPPVAGNKGQPTFFDLTVAYPDDSALEEAETRDGVCAPRGVVRLREVPVFCWIELEGDNFVPKKTKLQTDLLNGLKIRLARIEVLNCQLNARVSISQRQSARPAQTPYIASGTKSVESPVPLTAPLVKAMDKIDVLTITDTVDTSAAEFLTVPDYTAHIAGPRSLSLETKAGPEVGVVIIDQFNITKAARAEFDVLDLLVAICLDGKPLETKDALLADANGKKREVTRMDAVASQIKSQWQVTWMGVEA